MNTTTCRDKFRTVWFPPQCGSPYVGVYLQVLTKSSSKSQILSCSFYNVMHDRRSNVVYNFRFPLSSSRCRLAEWRRWQHSPRERRHCRKWFLGTSRDRGDSHVTVVRGREASRGAMTMVDNGALASLRRINKAAFNHRVFPPINLKAIGSSALQLHSLGVAAGGELFMGPVPPPGN